MGDTVDERDMARAPTIHGYSLASWIGGGGFGEVWYALNPSGEPCALKVIRRELFATDEHFNAEFVGISNYHKISQKHDGLINVSHIGQDKDTGFYWYEMELADDITFLSHVAPQSYVPATLDRREAPLPVEDCLDVGLTIAEALRFLHDHGLVHRDVKPSNVLYVQGKPRLADMGLTHQKGDGAEALGTRPYVPRNYPGTSMADVFALGKVLYEINTGQAVSVFPDLPEGFFDTSDFADRMQLNDVITRTCGGPPSKRIKKAVHLCGALERARDRMGKGDLRKPPGHSRGIAFIAGLVLLVGLVSLFGPHIRTVLFREQPTTATHAEGVLTVRAKSGRVLWEYQVKGSVAKAVVADLDGDGNKEVVAGIGGRAADSGKLLFFDYRGRCRPDTYVGEGCYYTGGTSRRLAVETLDTVPLPGRNARGILAIMNDFQHWFQACVVLVDPLGRERGRFWHPGNLGFVTIGSETADSGEMAVVAGMNNPLTKEYPGTGYLACVFLLDPGKLDGHSGEGPPYLLDGARDLHEWYAVISPRVQHVTEVEILDMDADERNEICIWTSRGHIFYVSFDGRLLSQTKSDAASGEATLHFVP